MVARNVHLVAAARRRRRRALRAAGAALTCALAAAAPGREPAAADAAPRAADPATRAPRVADAAPHAPRLEVRLADGLLSVDARGVPLADVLHAIFDGTPVRVVLVGALDAPVDRSIKSVALEKALRRLVGDAALVMVYTPADAAGETARRLTEVRVYGGVRGNPALARAPRTDPPAPAADEPARGATPRPDAAPARPAAPRPDARRRLRTVSALGARGDAGAVRELGAILGSDEDPRVRAAAARALVRVGDERAADALMTGLGDPDADIRSAVVDGLGTIGGEHATLGLGQVLFSEADPALRVQAVLHLAAIRADSARALVEAVATDANADVREAAEYALATWRGGGG